MNKKQIRILIPLGSLLLSLVLLAGCRPSTALTRILNAMNALNPSEQQTMTEEEQEEQDTSEQTDPMDEERDDAKIEEMDILIGQLLEDMTEEEAQEALEPFYSAAAEDHDWGTEEYDPEQINDTGSESSALNLYVRGRTERDESGRAGGNTSTVSDATGIASREGVESSDGTLESESVSITQDSDVSEAEGKGGASGGVVPGYSEAGESSGAGSSGPGTSGSDPDPEGSMVVDNIDEDDPEGSDDSEEEWEEIDYGHYIAATGDAAVMVCMLGCADRLVATSLDFQENDFAQRAWNSDRSMEYTLLWDDDGSTSLDETDFTYLMEVVHPDVCIETTGANTFTEDQIIRMQQEYKIGYYCIPSMTTQQECTDALGLLGTQLKIEEPEEEQQKIEAVVSAYETWVGNEIVKLATNTSSKTTKQTVFIEDWDETVETWVQVKSRIGYNDADWVDTNDPLYVTTGAAVIRIGRTFRPLNDYLTQAGVCDWAVNPHVWAFDYNMRDGYGVKGTKSGPAGYYSYQGYSWLDISDNNEGFRYINTNAGDLCYVSPIYDLLQGTQYIDSYYGTADAAYSQRGLYYVGGREGIGAIDASYHVIDSDDSESGNLSFGYIHPGYSSDNSKWDYVIAKTQDVAAHLTDPENLAWQIPESSNVTCFLKNFQFGYDFDTGESHVDVYGVRHSLNVQSQYLYDISYYTTVEGKYTVLVNPSGMMTWTEGSPESILESTWACWAITKGYGDEAFYNKISSFYETFYGLDLLGEDQDLMAEILAGPVS